MDERTAGVVKRASTTPRPVGKPGSFLHTLSNRFTSASAAGVYRDIDNASGGYKSPQVTGSMVNPSSGFLPPRNSPKKGYLKVPSIPSLSGGSRGSRGSGFSGSSGASGGSVVPSHTSAKKAWDYYEAPLAEKYNFGKETAYQEALANTAHRREMDDLRKAGINPSVYYGAHGSSGAESNIYPRDSSSGGYSYSGGSGGSGRRYGRRGNSGKFAFSGGAYYGAMAVAGTIAAVATHNAGVGMAVAGLTGTAMKAINGFLKK